MSSPDKNKNKQVKKTTHNTPPTPIKEHIFPQFLPLYYI